MSKRPSYMRVLIEYAEGQRRARQAYDDKLLAAVFGTGAIMNKENTNAILESCEASNRLDANFYYRHGIEVCTFCNRRRSLHAATFSKGDRTRARLRQTGYPADVILQGFFDR